MTLQYLSDTAQDAGLPTRSFGSVNLSTKARDGKSAICTLRSAGSAKVTFPRTRDRVEAIIVNTSGGLTSGDRFTTHAQAADDSHLTLTTQAAERVYRCADGISTVETRLSVSNGASIHWLPQELILYNGAALQRRMRVSLSTQAELLLVEPVVFGRIAMNERLTDARISDRVEILRDGVPLYFDAIDLSGPVDHHLSRSAIADGARAMASVVYVSNRAAGCLETVRNALPPTGGASLLAEDMLVLRLLAEDAFMLRKTLVPVLEHLRGSPLPKSWSL